MKCAEVDLEYGNLPDLVKLVPHSFSFQSKETLNAIFPTLEKVMESSTVVDGGNSYEMSHMNKRKMDSEDQLNHAVEYDHDLYYECSQTFVSSSST